MVCGKCGKAFDESAQATEGRCPFCKTVHTPKGDPIRELKGILSYIEVKNVLFKKLFLTILMANRRFQYLPT